MMYLILCHFFQVIYFLNFGIQNFRCKSEGLLPYPAGKMIDIRFSLLIEILMLISATAVIDRTLFGCK